MTESWFYICVTTIAKTIASLPLKLEKRVVTTDSIRDDNGVVTGTTQSESWVDASGSPEDQLFKYPNNFQTAVEFFTLVLIDLLATGDAYLYVDNGQSSEANELDSFSGKVPTAKNLYRINSALIEPIPDPNGFHIGAYALHGGDGYFTFEPSEIIHIKLPNPADPFRGLAPIVPVLKNVLLDRYSTEHHIRFYKQGARLGGVIKASRKLTKDQITRLQRSFDNDYTGRQNHHRTLVLPEGMDYSIIEQNPGQTQLIEFIKANREPILSAYNVPPVKIGILEGATFANALVQQKIFFNDTIIPILTYIEQALNLHENVLSEESRLRVRYDLSQVEALQENLSEQADTAIKMIQAGLTVNEVRKLIWKKPDLEGGDVAPAIEKAKPAQAFPFQLSSPNNTQTKDQTPNVQADTDELSDIVPVNATYEERLAQLISVGMGEGLSVEQAVEYAVNRIALEGFTPPSPEDVAAQATQEPKDEPVKAEELPEQDSKAKVERLPDESVDECVARAIPLLIEQGLEEEEAKAQAHSMCAFSPKSQAHPLESIGMGKEQIVTYWKDLSGNKVDKIAESHLKTVVEFFKRFEAIVLRKFKSKQKKHGHRWRIKADDEFIDDKELQKLLDAMKKEVDADMNAAMKHGYENTLVDVNLNYPDTDAAEILKEVGARNIKSVSDTTKEQIKRILVDGTEKNLSTAEISANIRDMFQKIYDNPMATRAATIARTDTLTAVSLGQQLKADEFKKEFPDVAMKKAWVSAQDERVRESHAGLDGEIVNEEEAFSNGLMFPRDPSGEASDVINCRCVPLYFTKGNEDDIKEILDEPSDLAETLESPKASSYKPKNPGQKTR